MTVAAVCETVRDRVESVGKMKIIGLTGGIGSGKSTVSSYLKSLGVPVFDADASSRAAVRKGNSCLEKIVAFFGPDCLQASGELDRAWVADRVFHDKDLLRQYEKIVQDQVRTEAEQFLKEQRERGTAVVLLDVPLLIECGWHRLVDSVWLVSVPETMQVQRAMLRDKETEEAIRSRIDAQMPLKEKEKFADVVIDNSGTVAHTQEQAAEQLWKLKKSL